MAELAPERKARARENAAREAEGVRLQAYWKWANSEEGQRAAAKVTDQVYTAPAAIPDAVFSGSVSRMKVSCSISSKAAGASLSIFYDARDAIATSTLSFEDGRRRQWIQGTGDTFSVGFGDGPFTEEEKLIAALLQSAPKEPWPGRTISKTRTDAEEIRKALWEKLQQDRHPAAER